MIGPGSGARDSADSNHRHQGHSDIVLLGQVVTRVPLVAVGLVVIPLGATLAAVGPPWSALGRWIWLVAGCWTLSVLGRRPARTVRRHDDPVLWRDLTFAVVFWSGAELLSWAIPVLGAASQPGETALELASLLLRTLSYIGLYLAIERQPHRRHRWRPVELERKLLRSTVWLVVPALVVYFYLLPFFLAEGSRARVSSVAGPSWILVGYLAMRLFHLMRVTESRRWRPIYWGLVLALVGRLIHDTFDQPGADQGAMFALAQAGELLSLWSLMLAAHARQYSFPLEVSRPQGRIRVEENLPGPLGQTMFFGIALPWMHYVLQIVGGVDAALAGQREALVMALLAPLAAVAFLQHHYLSKIIVQLRDEYSLMERRLHRVELDIRVQMRARRERAKADVPSAALVQASADCPDGLEVAMGLLEGGRDLLAGLPDSDLGRGAREILEEVTGGSEVGGD